MQFSDTSTNLGLIQEIDFLCDSDSTSYPTADKTRRINAAYEELVGLIINADGTWQFDDTNFTDEPVGTFTLVEGQESYSFATDYLQVEAIEILDDSSPAIFHRIKQLDHNELNGMSPEQYFGLLANGNPNTGFPIYYDIVSDTIKLYPAPTSTAVTLVSGGQIYFKRTVDLFTASDTTQEPGLPSTHHILLAYMAALPYNAIYHKERVGWLERKIGNEQSGMIRTLLKHYAHRNKDRVPKMTMKTINHI